MIHPPPTLNTHVYTHIHTHKLACRETTTHPNLIERT